MTETKWEKCKKPQTGDILRRNEPLWAKPNKPRGKRDKIGEQQIISQLTTIEGELLELTVQSVEKISSEEAPITVKQGDTIKRRKKSLSIGECHKRLG